VEDRLVAVQGVGDDNCLQHRLPWQHVATLVPEVILSGLDDQR
jgi:hypothetical protein